MESKTKEGQHHETSRDQRSARFFFALDKISPPNAILPQFSFLPGSRAKTFVIQNSSLSHGHKHRACQADIPKVLRTLVRQTTCGSQRLHPMIWSAHLSGSEQHSHAWRGARSPRHFLRTSFPDCSMMCFFILPTLPRQLPKLTDQTLSTLHSGCEGHRGEADVLVVTSHPCLSLSEVAKLGFKLDRLDCLLN